MSLRLTRCSHHWYLLQSVPGRPSWFKRESEPWPVLFFFADTNRTGWFLWRWGKPYSNGSSSCSYHKPHLLFGAMPVFRKHHLSAPANSSGWSSWEMMKPTRNTSCHVDIKLVMPQQVQPPCRKHGCSTRLIVWKQFHNRFTTVSHVSLPPSAFDLQPIDPHGGHQGLRCLGFVELIDLVALSRLRQFSMECQVDIWIILI